MVLDEILSKILSMVCVHDLNEVVVEVLLGWMGDCHFHRQIICATSGVSTWTRTKLNVK